MDSTENKMTDEQKNLVVDNIPLVGHLIKNIFHKSPISPDYEDLFQEGCLGLCYAAKRFDPSRGLAFSTYAGTYIINTIRKYRRDSGAPHGIRLPRPVIDHLISLGQEQGSTYSELDLSNESQETREVRDILTGIVDSLDFTFDNDHEFIEIVKDNFEWYRLIELKETISSYLESLTSKDQDIMYEYIYDRLCSNKREFDQKSVARRYRVSQPAVSRILNKRIKELRDLLIG